MNKNWLYRILAIALVAMLALPVFAMAEEVEEFDLGEIVLEEKKLSYEPGTAPEWDPADAEINPFDFDEGSKTYECNIDLGNLKWDDTKFLYENAMSTFKKTNSNSKVITVSQRGTMSLTGKTGKSKVTFTAKGAKTETKATCTINFNITNSAKIVVDPDDVEAYGYPSSCVAYLTPAKNAPTYVPQYKDGAPEEAATYYLTYKSSNKDVISVDFLSGEFTVGKAGKATITIREYWEKEDGERPLLVATLKKTITVKENKYKDTKADEEACMAAAKADEDVYIGVRSAEYTKLDKDDEGNLTGTGTLKVKLFVVNGTPNSISKIYGGDDCVISLTQFVYKTARERRLNLNGVEVDLGVDDYNYLKTNNSKSVSLKKNAKNIGTLEITIPGATVVDLTGDLKQVAVKSFFYKTTKNQLVPDEIWIKNF